ncbi:MAG: hypothetical protein GY697_12900 [Desulfobacterales bacterium]|nr:hypothetical protein [Desulfobacterales bacterium]
MADPRQSRTSNPAGVDSSSQKVELDRIELPPEPTPPSEPAKPSEPRVPSTADLPVDSADEEKPPAGTDSAAADVTGKETPVPPAPQKLSPAVWIILITTAGLAAAIWVFIGSLYIFEILFSR